MIQRLTNPPFEILRPVGGGVFYLAGESPFLIFDWFSKLPAQAQVLLKVYDHFYLHACTYALYRPIHRQ